MDVVEYPVSAPPSDVSMHKPGLVRIKAALLTEQEQKGAMRSGCPEQRASSQKPMTTAAIMQKPVWVCVWQHITLLMAFWGQTALALLSHLSPWGCCTRGCRAGALRCAAVPGAQLALRASRLGRGECCVYQASGGMLGLQDNGYLGSQKNLNSLPRWKIVPFHPLYN